MTDIETLERIALALQYPNRTDHDKEMGAALDKVIEKYKTQIHVDRKKVEGMYYTDEHEDDLSLAWKRGRNITITDILALDGKDSEKSP